MGRPRNETCKRGHELTEETRYVWHGEVKGCVKCRRMNSQRHRSRKAGRARRAYKHRSPKVVPSAPLVELLERFGLKATARVASDRLGIGAGSVERLVFRAKADGLFTVASADALCIALGKHPAEVYGPAWFTYGEVADAV